MVRIKLKLILILAVLFITFSSAAQTNSQYSFNIIEQPTFNNNTAFVNSSRFWNTITLGPLDDANVTQFENNGGVLSIMESFLTTFGNGVWCALGGCTMTGNIDMNGNSMFNLVDIDTFFLDAFNATIDHLEVVTINATNISADFGNFTELFVSNSTLTIGNVSISSFENVLKIEDGKTLNASFYIGDASGLFNFPFNDSASFNATGDQRWIQRLGDTFSAEETQFNFTFVDPGHAPAQGLVQYVFKSEQEDAGMTLRVENDVGIGMVLFSGGSNRIGVGELNNFSGLGVEGTDMNFILQELNTSYIWRQFNGTGLRTSMELEEDGNLLLANDLILDSSAIFFDDDGDHFTKINVEGFPFNGIATNATWFGHDTMKDEGEITFLFTEQNETNLWMQSGRNNSFGGFGGSLGIVPQYMAEENFTELNGIINMSKASDYLFLCNLFGMDCSFDADTRGNAINLLPGGPLLWTMGDLEIWQSAKIHEGLAVSGPVIFDLEGNHLDVTNGTLHPSTQVTFEEGFNQGDSVTKFIETFSGS